MRQRRCGTRQRLDASPIARDQHFGWSNPRAADAGAAEELVIARRQRLLSFGKFKEIALS